MALVEKFHKTGGSHVDFCGLGTFCDIKKTVRAAALHGNFFKDQKYDNFKAFFKNIVSLNLQKVLFKTENGKYYFILCLTCVFCI